MSKRYTSEKDILDLAARFEAGTIDRADWKHAEHLTVALFYISTNDLETATAKMRSGIYNLLRTFGVDLTREMPYHETLTVFWMRIVADFYASENTSALLDKANELVARYDKDFPLKFYSRELLFSEEARARFVKGDLIETRKS